jgi:transcriptional regulator with XRE-family HTH domain
MSRRIFDKVETDAYISNRMSVLEEVRKRLKAVRESKDLTLEAVSKRSGISTSFLWQLENSNTDISLGNLEALAVGLGISLPNLVDEKLSIPSLVSTVALDVFCQEDKINAAEKARLKNLVDEGIASFSTPENWRSHYRTRMVEQARRPSLAQLPRAGEAPETYITGRTSQGARRKKPSKR